MFFGSVVGVVGSIRSIGASTRSEESHALLGSGQISQRPSHWPGEYSSCGCRFFPCRWRCGVPRLVIVAFFFYKKKMFFTSAC